MIDPAITDRAFELRRAFDRSFAETPLEGRLEVTDFLGIRVAGDPYSLRLEQLSGVSTRRPITPLPTAVPGLLGITGVRGALVPVYDLGALLEYSSGRAPSWLALVGKESALAIAFDEFDGYVRVPLDAIVRRTGDTATALSWEVVRMPGAVRPVVDLPRLVDAIRRQAHQSAA
jgi:chemotaxis signal transduction protein